MKPVINYIGEDNESKRIFSQLATLFNQGLGTDNLNLRIIEGTTNAAANTEELFRHNATTLPIAYIPVTGNVYVNGFDITNIDVRSTGISQAFKLYILLG